jgi:hypothetical protein
MLTAVYDRRAIVDITNDYASLLALMADDPNMRLRDLGIKPR